MRARNLLTICFGVFTSVLSLACFSLLSNYDVAPIRPLVRIRFINQTGRDLQQLLIGRSREFGALPKDCSSAYHCFVGVPSDYLGIQAITAGDHIVRTQLFCGTGEEDLPTGAYRCVLTVDDMDSDALDTKLQEDLPALTAPCSIPGGERLFTVVPQITESEAAALAQRVPTPAGIRRERFGYQSIAFIPSADRWYVYFGLLPGMSPDSLHRERGYTVELDPSGRFSSSDTSF